MKTARMKEAATKQHEKAKALTVMTLTVKGMQACMVPIIIIISVIIKITFDHHRHHHHHRHASTSVCITILINHRLIIDVGAKGMRV